MPVSAVQIVVGSHQHCGERDSGSPLLAGGDPLLCKKSHFNPFCIFYAAGCHQCWMMRKSSPPKRSYKTQDHPFSSSGHT